MDLYFKASNLGPDDRDEAHAYMQPITERMKPFLWGFNAVEQLFDATKAVMRERGLDAEVMNDAEERNLLNTKPLDDRVAKLLDARVLGQTALARAVLDLRSQG
jgi:hypothetical protein